MRMARVFTADRGRTEPRFRTQPPGDPGRLALPERNEVHLWLVEPTAGPLDLCGWWEHLPLEEKDRARAIPLPRVRDGYILRHGVLRHLIHRYLGVDAQGVKCARHAYGKPYLPAEENPGDLRFNLSSAARAGGAVCCAFAVGREVGVDIESVDRVVDRSSIARHFFCVEEQRFLETLPAGERARAFLGLWTLKEAYWKGVGEGLQGLTKNVPVVPLDPRLSASRVGDAGNSWTLVRFHPSEGLVGALAVADTPSAAC